MGPQHKNLFTLHSASLLKAEDVATILNVSRSYAYLLMENGSLPTVRLGKSCRVRPQDLEDFIERNLHRQDYG